MKILLRTIIYIIIVITVLSGCGNKGKSLIIEKIEPDQGHMSSGMNKQKKDAILSPGDIQKADYTIEECYALKQNLNAKSINIRGKVVKYNPEIMGRNWIHIQDGTGSNEDFDLTVTSRQGTSVGKIILVTGKIMYDQIFAETLKYPVIIIDAKIIEEK